MVSGAGHDAMILAEKVPSAMIFLRTPGGISHDPAETVTSRTWRRRSNADCTLLDQLASSPEFQRKDTPCIISVKREAPSSRIICC